MKKLRLYPDVIVTGQSFKGVKVSVVPDQSMSLAEIIKRFIRKESLPVLREGVYNEDLGDIEKMAHEDITVTEDRGRALRSEIERVDKASKARKKAAEAAKKEAKQIAVPDVKIVPGG